MLGLGPPSPAPPRSRTLYKILDSCKQLTLAQGAGEEDPSGMVTIITGLPLDNPSTLSGPMQVGHGLMFGEERNGAEVPESTPSDQTAVLFFFHHPFPSPSTT